MVDRAAALKAHEAAVIKVRLLFPVTTKQQQAPQVIADGIGVDLDTLGGRQALLPCILRLLTLEVRGWVCMFMVLLIFPQDYEKAKSKTPDVSVEEEKRQHSRHGKHAQRKDSGEDLMSPKTQGALLLQSLLQLASPHNQVVLDRFALLPRS